MLPVALLSICLGLMAYAAASDLLTMRIPNWLSLALLAAFAAFFVSGALPWDAALMHVAAAALVLAVCFALFALRWMGGGDAKLAAATALWLGFDYLMTYLVYASLFGGALTLLLIQFRMMPLPSMLGGQKWAERLHSKDAGVPYGIALAAAALAVYPETPWMNAIHL
jgi:prepilin peptidase CpaA